MNKKEEAVAAFMQEAFPDAKCALVFSNPFECLVAVMLSAQTTDKSVNLVTPALFKAFGTPEKLAAADVKDVEAIIKSLGLYKNKAKNLLGLSKELVGKHNGVVPGTREELVRLPGVGIKTANVVLAECFNVPAIAVDTHVTRVSNRLGYAKEGTDPVKIEKILEKKFPKELHIKLHHQLIWFGREICHARNPECARCKLGAYCSFFKKTSIKTGR